MSGVAAKHLSLMVTAVVLAGAPALAQTPQERAWCEGEDAVSVDQRIDGCSAVIKAARDRGDKLAEAFNNRGIAYRLKGEYDRAVQDYNQAIKLNAKFAAPSTIAASPTTGRATMIAPSRITIRRSSSSPRPSFTSTAATRI